MNKYFLIIVASAVADELMSQLRYTHNNTERDVRNRIRDYVEAAGIDPDSGDFSHSVRQINLPNDRCAFYFRNGFADAFDSRVDIDKSQSFFILGEDGKILDGTLSRQERIEKLWQHLKKGFWPYQTGPAIDVTMYGDKEKGVVIEEQYYYPSPEEGDGISYRVCKPEHFEEVYDTLLHIDEALDDPDFDVIHRYFEDTDTKPSINH